MLKKIIIYKIKKSYSSSRLHTVQYTVQQYTITVHDTIAVCNTVTVYGIVVVYGTVVVYKKISLFV